MQMRTFFIYSFNCNLREEFGKELLDGLEHGVGAGRGWNGAMIDVVLDGVAVTYTWSPTGCGGRGGAAVDKTMVGTGNPKFGLGDTGGDGRSEVAGVVGASWIGGWGSVGVAVALFN